ncbi:hypothetical protein LOTGIDRAFT_110056 [Lottia gigantea]|uniref:Ribosome biogenesis regulatory protein n=1 Tax=Lottia gigantea TaxID=225164 RepID=V4CN38_LOTGI|nr:hypothetical protein LOTGIDRAFT_110056 [Lottia gigantea]ESP03800.1 hypothetical protein LOTGIDRAFT_110056 [Lottia gigantea]
MADLVESILREEAEKESKYKTIFVEKDADVEIDEGNLLACDPNPIDVKLFKSNKDDFINNLARDNTQLLFNQLWMLPVERVDNTVLAKLPKAKTLIPREKRLPKPRPETKWEKFAKAKGIHKKKGKDKMAWDEQHKEFRPRYGYNRANDDTKDWLIEMKSNAADDEDPFEKRITERKERRAKNELQRLRNIARSQYGGKVPGVGLTPVEKPNKDQLGRALVLAKKSTASLGKFTERLPKEKNTVKGKKRKFEPCVGDMKKEKDKQLRILKTLSHAVPINVAKAASHFMSQEPDERYVFYTKF